MCCSDHVHCCPNGYSCEVSTGKCNKGNEIIMNWFEKVPAIRRDLSVTVENVICPDRQHQCPTGNTCCKLASGQWGCCPIPNVSLYDGHSQCPAGNTCCKLASGQWGCCPIPNVRNYYSYNWLFKAQEPKMPYLWPIVIMLGPFFACPYKYVQEIMSVCQRQLRGQNL